MPVFIKDEKTEEKKIRTDMRNYLGTLSILHEYLGFPDNGGGRARKQDIEYKSD